MKKTLILAAITILVTTTFANHTAVASPQGKCKACHNFTMKDKVGPHLKGIVGRKAGQSGFKRHSEALKHANWIWDEAHLLKWICNSKEAIKEFTGNPHATTKMPIQKLCGEKGKKVVAFLKSIS